MKDVSTRPLTTAAALVLGSKLRCDDQREVVLMGGDPTTAISTGLLTSELSRGIYDGNEIIGAFGYTSTGVVWSLYADLTPAQSRSILFQAPGWIGRMRRTHGQPLWNYVPADHKKTIRWLKATGCIDFPPLPPMNFNGVPHLKFTTKEPSYV